MTVFGSGGAVAFGGGDAIPGGGGGELSPKNGFGRVSGLVAWSGSGLIAGGNNRATYPDDAEADRTE